jgi:hypothetical protein
MVAARRAVSGDKAECGHLAVDKFNHCEHCFAYKPYCVRGNFISKITRQGFGLTVKEAPRSARKWKRPGVIARLASRLFRRS